MNTLGETATLLPQDRLVYSVSRLNREVRGLLEGGLPLLWVEGEISNLARPASGHIYFSLKDEAAQVRCVMFRQRNMLLPFAPANGAKVQVRARVSLYEARGDFQLICEHMEQSGDGALQRTFDALKRKLAAEGLFDTARKRPLPSLPRSIGVITSPSGAAIRDVLSVLGRRFPAIPVVIYPSAVQGEGAAVQLVKMLQTATRRAECDVLILCRGGGSLEDLWSFNDEAVARAIVASAIPVISGVGHETDITIADLAADQRAPTPSGAAELAVPDASALLRQLVQAARTLDHRLETALERRIERLESLRQRLGAQHPGRRLQDRSQRLDELEGRLRQAARTRLISMDQRLALSHSRLNDVSPERRLEQLEERITVLGGQLRDRIRRRTETARGRLALAAGTLEAVSPLATLGRGYAIVTDTAGHVLRSAAQARPGMRIQAQLARGRLHAQVDDIEEDS